MARAQYEAMEEFVRTHSPALMRHAYLLTGGDEAAASDLLQDTWVAVCKHWSRITATDNPLAYVRRTMVNRNVSTWRKSSRELASGDATELTLPPVPASENTTVDQQVLVGFLKDLPPKQRAAVVMRFFEDMSDRQIAEVLDCREATVRSQIFHALAKLRERMTASEATPGHRQEPS